MMRDVAITSLARGIHVLICEDDAVTREFLMRGLGHFGIQVTATVDGKELDLAMQSEEPDIVLLDIGLPGEDGFSIAARLRRDHPHVGIIMLTARGEVDDRVKGLDSGADIYFAKPTDIRELASAVGSLHRRLKGRRVIPTVVANWRLDVIKSALVTPSGIEIQLTDNELRFLSPLLAHPGEVLDREFLLKALGHHSDIYGMRRMETLLSRLRAKVHRHSSGEILPVRARHSRGYAFLSEGNLD